MFLAPPSTPTVPFPMPTEPPSGSTVAIAIAMTISTIVATVPIITIITATRSVLDYIIILSLLARWLAGWPGAGGRTVTLKSDCLEIGSIGG